MELESSEPTSRFVLLSQDANLKLNKTEAALRRYCYKIKGTIMQSNTSAWVFFCKFAAYFQNIFL